MGGLGQLARAVPHESHAKSVAAYFIAAQSGLAIPVLSIGALTGPLGLTTATTLVIAVVMVLAAAAWIVNHRSPRGTT
jgi:Kef-type K+ transport system membrane component KefB